MSLLPIFLSLDARNGLVVGGGAVALDKIGSLLRTGLRLSVVAPQARPEIRELAGEGKLTWIERPFEPSDLDNKVVVIAATDKAAVNAAVYRAARERGLLCNSVDDIPHCDFFFGAVVRRGQLQIAISTAGESPSFAQLVRREIDEQLAHDLGPWLENIGQLRREILATHAPGEPRRLLLHQLAQRPVWESPSGPAAPAALRQHSGHAQGKVFLVGAGPGDPDLLTVKALRLLQSAEVILHDDLVPQAILDLASPAAEIVNVGKRCGIKNITQEEIHALMIGRVQAGRSVIRLKSGDPLIFGRAAEEIAALAEAGIAFEIVPGITSAFAAAAALGCSLTSRNSASSVLFSTGHHAQARHQAPLPQREDATRIVYMPGRDLRSLMRDWLSEGLPAGFPCAIISRAGQPGQSIQRTTLSGLADIEPVPAPSLLIAGWALRESTAASAQEMEQEATPA